MGVSAQADAVATRTLEFTGDDPAVLLRDLLAELLYVFESEGLCVIATDVVAFDDDQLKVVVQLAPVEAEGAAGREVKAVTYHELAVRRVEGGFEAVYIVDI
jgi:SHS2 domain-containing protein